MGALTRVIRRVIEGSRSTSNLDQFTFLLIDDASSDRYLIDDNSTDELIIQG